MYACELRLERSGGDGGVGQCVSRRRVAREKEKERERREERKVGRDGKEPKRKLFAPGVRVNEHLHTRRRISWTCTRVCRASAQIRPARAINIYPKRDR